MQAFTGLRALILAFFILSGSSARADEIPPMECSESEAFDLRFRERVSDREVRRALREYPDFSNLLVNDGDASRPLFRVTAIALYESPEEAEAMMYLMVASMLESERFHVLFSEGHIDSETLDNAIIFYSGDFESNEGLAMQIAHEYSSVLVTCTDLRGRSEAFTVFAR